MSKRRKVEHGMFASAAFKWNAMNGLGRFIVKLLIAIPMIAAAGQGWIWLGWFYPASREWVLQEVQAPVYLQYQSLLSRGIQNRLSQIETELLQAETARALAKNPAEQAKWALQAEKLRTERAELLQELKPKK